MALPTYATVLSQINTYIVANGNNEITANVLNPILELILDFSNNNIGDLDALTTDEKNSIVEAINSLKQNFDDLVNNGVQLYTGINDPNDTPPPTYKYADFYMQLDIDSLPVKLWQWNGFVWTDESGEPATESDNVINNSDVTGVTVTDALNNIKTGIDYLNTTFNYGLTEFPPSEINTATWDGFPMLFQSKTGKLILINKSGVAHGGAGSSGIRTSLDGGKTFSSYTALVNEAGKYNGISGGCVTATGRVVLFYFIATPGVGTDEIGYFYSDDDAVTWSSRITMPMGSNVGGGWTGKSIEIAEGKLMQVWWGADGTLTLPATVHTLYAVFSTDNGSTWGNQTVITTGTSGTNDPYTEASFVYLEGNAIVGLVRKDGKDFYTQFKSEDNGSTWTNQGDETFENFNGNPGAPELQTYIDLDGKKTVICYFSNRIDLNVKSILGRNLLSGVSGWIESTETILRSGLTNYDSGYPSAIHPNGSRFGLVAYYEAKNLTNDADIQFVISRPDNEIILPNAFLTVTGQVKAGSFRGANLTPTYLPKATTAGQLINSTQLTEDGTTLNVNNPGNTFSRFSVKDGTNLGLYFKVSQTDATGMMVNAVNDALSANIPLELRGSAILLTGGVVQAVNLAGTGTRQVVADASGNLLATDIAPTSGTYTPTITGIGNFTSNTFISATYTVIGNSVTVLVDITVKPTLSSTLTEFSISLPINVSVFGGTQSSIGVGTFANTDYLSIRVSKTNSTTAKASFKTLTDANSGSVSLIFTYQK